MRRTAIAVLLLMGIGCLIAAAYIPAKGWLAQRLLDRAWQLGQSRAITPPPWPWADTRPVMRLVQPRLDISQFVLDGASGRVLAFGPGRVSGSAMPGEKGNLVISGHRDTHFRWLADLRAGDVLQTSMGDGALRRYRVASTQIHHVNDVALLDPFGGDQLRLVTCYPLNGVDVGTQWRYVVTALPEPDAVF